MKAWMLGELLSLFCCYSNKFKAGWFISNKGIVSSVLETGSLGADNLTRPSLRTASHRGVPKQRKSGKAWASVPLFKTQPRKTYRFLQELNHQC